MNAMTEYKEYTDADKIALRELCEYATAKIGGTEKVKTSDMICAVTPGLETPKHLQGI